MLKSIGTKALYDQRWSFPAWSGAFLLLIGGVIGLWPAFASAMEELAGFMRNMPPALRAMFGDADLSTARGFLSVELFSYILPILVAVLAIGRGAGTIAGEEQRGDLTLVLVRPVSRGRIAIEKAIALLVSIIGIVAVATLVALAAISVADMDVTTGEIVGAMVGLALLGCFFGAIAFAVGAATGLKVVALGAASAVALISYLAATFGPLIPSLSWLFDISPWAWAFGDDPIADGVSGGGAAGLIALTVGLIAVGTLIFQRRDIRG